MKVRVLSGHEVHVDGTTYQAGDVLTVADETAERFIAAGDAKATLRAKPVLAPRPLTPNQSLRSNGK